MLASLIGVDEGALHLEAYLHLYCWVDLIMCVCDTTLSLRLIIYNIDCQLD